MEYILLFFTIYFMLIFLLLVIHDIFVLLYNDEQEFLTLIFGFGMIINFFNCFEPELKKTILNLFKLIYMPFLVIIKSILNMRTRNKERKLSVLSKKYRGCYNYDIKLKKEDKLKIIKFFNLKNINNNYYTEKYLDNLNIFFIKSIYDFKINMKRNNIEIKNTNIQNIHEIFEIFKKNLYLQLDNNDLKEIYIFQKNSLIEYLNNNQIPDLPLHIINNELIINIENNNSKNELLVHELDF